MVKPLKQIEQEIEKLEKEIANLAEELQKVYGRYIALLGESLQRQLVLASYQVCTQAYPEAFLSLSVEQRQNFSVDRGYTVVRLSRNLFLYLLLIIPPSLWSRAANSLQLFILAIGSNQNKQFSLNIMPNIFRAKSVVGY